MKHSSKCPSICLKLIANIYISVLVSSLLTHTAALYLCKSLPGVVALPLSIGDSALTASRACGPGRPLWPLAMLGPRALVTLFNTLAPTTPLQRESEERNYVWERWRQRKGGAHRQWAKCHKSVKNIQTFQWTLPFIFFMMTVCQTKEEGSKLQPSGLTAVRKVVV